jgi:hypothetical protein
MSFDHTKAVAAIRMDDSLAKLLLFQLADFADGDGKSFPSKRKLEDLTGMSFASIKRKLKVLCDAGFLTIQYRDQWSSVYRLSLKALEAAGTIVLDDPAERVRDEDCPDHREVPPAPTEPHNLLLNQPIEKYISRSSVHAEPPPDPEHLELAPTGRQAIQDEFAEFWKIYPKKAAKLGAIKAYEKARRIASKEEILAGAEAYSRSRMGENPQYTALATTWLNRGSWMDEADSASAAAGPRHFSKDEAASSFEAFWQMFPRKDNRESAFAVYCEAVKWAQPNEIRLAAEQLSGEADRVPGFVVPHANSWLMENFISRRRILIDNKSSMWKNGIASVA